MSFIFSNKLIYTLPPLAAASFYLYNSNMPRLQALRAANAAFTVKRISNPVAVFVGGTSGIGKATMYEYTKSTVSPKIYFVGRSPEAGASITSELQSLNPSAKISFIQSDLSLLKNAYSAATKIREAESSINLLFVSIGYATMNGATKTEENLERKMVVHYYSRFTFASVLLPLLQAGTKSELGSRMVSMFSAGQEGRIIEDDMGLVQEKNFSLTQAAKQSAAMNSLAIEYLAKQNPEIGWIHAYPSMVMTNVGRDMPFWVRATLPLFSFLAVDIKDSAQGFLNISTDEKFAKGMSLVDWKGKAMDTRTGPPGWFGGEKGWWREDLPEKVWKHTEDTYESVIGHRV